MEHDELDQYLDALQREDSYRVESVLKQSAFETTQLVYFVEQDGTETGPFIRKFIQREAELGSAYERIYAAQQQGHRFTHLPTVRECYQRDEQLAVVIEYVAGETLQELVYRSDPSVALARAVYGSVCDAVAELHESFMPAIIHRDLKPSNIIMDNGCATIIDFGIAREFKSTATQGTTHFGTRAFAPPEQFGYGQTTVRSDVYALGMLLYFCLTEKIPDAGLNPAGFNDVRIPPALRPVLAKATAFDPMNRYANARELKGAFEAALREYDASLRGSASISAGFVQAGTSAANAGAAATANVTGAAPAAVAATTRTTTVAGSANTAAQQSQSQNFFGAHIRNAFILLVGLAFIPSFIQGVMNPMESVAVYGQAYAIYSSAVAVPFAILGLLWLFVDRRPLIKRFPALGKVTLKHWIAIYLVVMFLLLIIGAALMQR